MTQSTGGGEGRWPFERVGDGPAATSSGATPAGTPAADRAAPRTGAPGGAGAKAPAGGGSARGSARRRPPAWLLVALALVVVGAAVALVVLLTGDREEPEVPAAQTVTLPPPTPTIDPVERAPGTPFAEALPTTVLQFALTEQVEHEPLLAAGALEGYRLTYSDGGSLTLTVLAGQWLDAAGPAGQLDAVLAEVGDVPEASGAAEEPAADEGGEDAEAGEGETAAPTPEPLPDPEQGPVTVGGEEVGRYVFVPREDGTGTLWWTNSTVLVQLDGPWQELRSVFAAFPL